LGPSCAAGNNPDKEKQKQEPAKPPGRCKTLASVPKKFKGVVGAIHQQSFSEFHYDTIN
jgi:hypothetical protein